MSKKIPDDFALGVHTCAEYLRMRATSLSMSLIEEDHGVKERRRIKTERNLYLAMADEVLRLVNQDAA